MLSVRTILKNILSLSAAQVVTKLITVVVTAYTARILGAAQYGRWCFATIFASYFSVLATLGLDSIAARHLARERDRLHDLVAQVVRTKLFASLCGLFAVAMVAWALPKPAEIKWLILLCYLPLSLGFWSLMWVFIGLERLDLVAISQLMEQLVNAGLIFLLLHSPDGVMCVPMAATGGVMVSGACLFAVYCRRYGGTRGRWKREQAVALVREALPFAGTQLLGQMYLNFDSVLLSFLRADTEVGWYNAAYKLVLVIINFRFTIIYSLNPTFARLFVQSRDHMLRLTHRVFQLAVLTALPIGVGGTLLAEPIIRGVFGVAYLPSAAPLRVLVWSAVAQLLNLIGAVLLTAAGRWKTMLKLTGVVVAVNIATNLFLIPRWGMVGAAWATVLADGVSLVLYWWVMRQIVAIPFGQIMIKPLLSAAVMGLILWPLRLRSIYLTIPLGATAYVACLFALGAVRIGDLKSIMRFKEEP
jgi:O-antigen/teichoic acid export membrane protein